MQRLHNKMLTTFLQIYNEVFSYATKFLIIFIFSAIFLLTGLISIE